MQDAAQPANAAHTVNRSPVFPFESSRAVVLLALLVPRLIAAQGEIPSDAVRPTSHAARLSVTYDGDAMRDVAGGERRGGAYIGELGVQFLVNGRRTIGWRGASLYAHVVQDHGMDPSEVVGDAQGVSSLAAPPGWRLDELWFQQSLDRDRLSLLAGRYDVNSEFYRLETAGLFLNSSFGIGPEFAGSGREGPSTAPYTAVGARLRVKPSDRAVIRLAVMNGAPVDRPGGGVRLFAPGDGALLVGEAAVLFTPKLGIIPRNHRIRVGRGQVKAYGGKLALGGWLYTASFADLADTTSDGRPVMHRGSRGAYLLGDQTIWTQDADSTRQLAVFGQLGVGDSRVERFGRYLGAGLVFTGLLPGRGADELGLALASAHNGGPWVRSALASGMPAAETESTYELSYLTQIGGWLAVQPDLQYVVRPGTMRTLHRAVVLGARFELAR